MKDAEKQPEAKAPAKEPAPKQKFTLDELKALGLDPVPYGYPAEK